MRILNQLCRRATGIKVSTGKVRYRPVIGLEIHAQISSKSKMFSSAAFDDEANVNSTVELFDMATPGTLPVLNKDCVLKGISAGVLLNCTIAQQCRFERKHYFYADMPAGYQITQQRSPIAYCGHLDYFVHSSEEHFSSYRRRLHISRIQLEIDSGKTVHDLANNRSLIDLNRAGVGLLEIVTEPELNSALEAYCFIEQLRIMLALNGICCGEMHKGQLRIDANISLAVDGSSDLGVRTEVKNLNSLKSVYSAINYEIARQYEVLNEGGEVLNETRAADHKGHTVAMREKEIETDYRFMPEPNLPPVHIDPELIVTAIGAINRRPSYVRYIEEYEFDPDAALRIAKDERLSKFIDKVLSENSFDGRFLLDWLKELKRICHNCNIDYPPIREKFSSNFATILHLNHIGRITRLTAIDLIRNYVNDTRKDTPLQMIEHENLWQINEIDRIKVIVDTVFDGHQELVAKAKAQPAVVSQQPSPPYRA
uniref:Glutamyl-tRNA(Gln) amidotransferase subunit B, mitochondrial n=2 Tax=Parascaris univalens TaxID=6257 RepID=A0A915B793_PARUN